MRKALAATELALAAVLSGCAGTTSPSVATELGQNTIYVVHHGTLHTGLTIRRSTYRTVIGRPALILPALNI